MTASVFADSPDAQLQAAQHRADRIRKSFGEALDVVARAIEARDWETLGFDSPGAWWADLTDLGKVKPLVRQRLVSALRREGYSLRRIAAELEISKDTAARDAAQVSHDETPGQPERITGADGKSYAASRPEPEESETEPESVSPRVARIIELTSMADAMEALAEEKRQMAREQRQLAAQLRETAPDDWPEESREIPIGSQESLRSSCQFLLNDLILADGPDEPETRILRRRGRSD